MLRSSSALREMRKPGTYGRCVTCGVATVDLFKGVSEAWTAVVAGNRGREGATYERCSSYCVAANNVLLGLVRRVGAEGWCEGWCGGLVRRVGAEGWCGGLVQRVGAEGWCG
eukprot:273063-Chlamydomonas_euryale.AAC.1